MVVAPCCKGVTVAPSTTTTTAPDIFDALVATLNDTRLEPDLEDLLWSTVNLFAESAAAIGMVGNTQRSDSMVSMPSPAASTSFATPKRTAWPRRSPIARRGVSIGALPSGAW